MADEERAMSFTTYFYMSMVAVFTSMLIWLQSVIPGLENSPVFSFTLLIAASILFLTTLGAAVEYAIKSLTARLAVTINVVIILGAILTAAGASMAYPLLFYALALVAIVFYLAYLYSLAKETGAALPRILLGITVTVVAVPVIYIVAAFQQDPKTSLFLLALVELLITASRNKGIRKLVVEEFG